MPSYTFGPVSSRRFGVSLGIDLSPETKSCNFDCVYCELPKAERTDIILNPPKVADVLADVQKALISHPQTEVITITANGEPTLYPELENLVNALQTIKGDRRLMILTNASTLPNSKVRAALVKLDSVKCSLDCVTPRCYQRIDRPLHTDVTAIIDALTAFRSEYSGELLLEILLVSGINDNLQEFETFANILPQIGADRIDIGTIDRPPAYDVKPVPFEKIAMLCETLKNLPINIVTKRGNTPSQSYYSDEELLTTFAKRPFTQDDVERLLDADSVSRLTQLVADGRIHTIEKNGLLFYHTK